MSALLSTLLSCDPARRTSSASPAGTAAAAERGQLQHDLGTIPPGFRTSLEFALRRPPAPSHLQGVASTCGCLEPRVTHQGRQLAAGELIPAAGALSLALDFAPKRPEGPESVRVRFATRGRQTHQDLVLAYRVDPAASLVGPDSRIVLEVDLSRPATDLDLPLRHALPTDRAPTLTATGAAAGLVRVAAAAGGLHLDMTAVDVTGTYTGELRLPFGERGYQVVPLRIVATAPESVSPAAVVSRIPVDGVLAYPVSLRGDGWETGADLIESVTHPAHGTEGDPAGFVVRPTYTAEKRPQPKLVLTFVAGRHPGVYEGRVLVRPNRRVRYRVAVPYTIAVVAMEQRR